LAMPDTIKTTKINILMDQGRYFFNMKGCQLRVPQ
jgi:hypothetical protein